MHPMQAGIAQNKSQVQNVQPKEQRSKACALSSAENRPTLTTGMLKLKSYSSA